MGYSIDELANAWIETFVVLEQRNLVPAYMGKHDGAGSYIYAGSQTGVKWVRTAGGESAAPFEAWNNLGASDDYTIAVWVTTSPEGKKIIFDYRREA